MTQAGVADVVALVVAFVRDKVEPSSSVAEYVTAELGDDLDGDALRVLGRVSRASVAPACGHGALLLALRMAELEVINYARKLAYPLDKPWEYV